MTEHISPVMCMAPQLTISFIQFRSHGAAQGAMQGPFHNMGRAKARLHFRFRGKRSAPPCAWSPMRSGFGHEGHCACRGDARTGSDISRIEASARLANTCSTRCKGPLAIKLERELLHCKRMAASNCGEERCVCLVLELA